MSVRLREKKLADGRVSLYLDIYVHGKRTYEFLNLYLGSNAQANKDTRNTAEIIRSERQAEVSGAVHGIVPIHRQRIDFLDYFDLVIASKTPSTQKVWKTALVHVKKYAGGRPVPLHSVNKAWLEGFKTYLLGTVSKNTAASYFTHVKGALRHAYDNDMIRVNPAQKVRGIELEETERDFLLFEELSKLAVTPCRYPEVRRAFLYACYTGLRFSDVQKLRWRDLHQGRLKVRQQKTGGVEHLYNSEQAEELLGAPGDPDDLVFTLPSHDTVGEVLKEWAASAEVKKHVTFHVARHTFATLLLENNVDLYTVSKLLGHKSIKVTEIYAKVVDKKKREAVAAIPKLPRLAPSAQPASSAPQAGIDSPVSIRRSLSAVPTA